MGLTSRAGIVPLNLFADIAGPMARTMADAVAVFQVVVGYDPNDPATEATRARAIPDYSKSLVRDGLKGARLGVLRRAYERPTLDTEVVRVFDNAIAELRRAGATVVDTVVIPQLDSATRLGRGGCNPFKYELNRWLAEQGDRVPMKTLDTIIKSRLYHPSIQQRLESAQAVQQSPDSTPGCQGRQRVRDAVRAVVTQTMDSLKLDALIYPTWSNPPRLIGDLTTPHGDNSQVFSPQTGMPAITVPMGYTRNNALPAGLQMLGRAFDEPTLIKLGYGYEQATRHRKAPPTTP
jgi:Asp-tRNA(Asn)/Glu-tRNA(Gln) amidotransferase A subunit family amidase